MHRALLILVLAPVLAIALAGCGGDEEDAGPTPSATAPATDPEPSAGAPPEVAAPLETFERFLSAAAEPDAARMWALFSSSAREAFGPTRAEFAASGVSAFAEGAGTWSRADYDVVVDERMRDSAVVAIAGRRTAEGQTSHDAYAVPLREEGGEWRIAFGGPRVTSFEPLPGQDETAARPRITATFESPTPIREARMWLDGRETSPEVDTRGAQTTVSIRPAAALDAGNHSVVVFVVTDDQPAATAWSFASAAT